MEAYCLITVGATVGFQDLTQSVLEPGFLQYIRSKGFTHLRVQCGPDIKWATAELASQADKVPDGLDIEIFDVRNNLMKEEMVLCKPLDGKRRQGLVISHAGTGTILDAWKLGLPIIVVPNTRLLDDHQTEMAKHLSKEGYAIMSTGSPEDLQGAIDKTELLLAENKSRWPPHKVAPQSSERLSLWDIGRAEVAREEDASMAHD